MRSSPTCAVTSSGRRTAATPPSSRPVRATALSSGRSTPAARRSSRRRRTATSSTRFLLPSVIGADRPERRNGGVREFLAAKQHAERRLVRLEVPWTILRFGRLTEDPGNGRIDTALRPGAPVTTSRDDAALAIADALERPHLARQVVNVVDGERRVASALDAVEPLPLPPPSAVPTGPTSSLGAAQADNPPDDPDMIEPDALPLDADVDWEGDGPVSPQPVGNEDPAPGIP